MLSIHHQSIIVSLDPLSSSTCKGLQLRFEERVKHEFSLRTLHLSCLVICHCAEQTQHTHSPTGNNATQIRARKSLQLVCKIVKRITKR